MQDYVPHDPAGRSSKNAHLLWVFDRYLRDAGPGSLLDIGCADGAFLDIAAAANWRVVGLDSYQQGGSNHTIVTGRFQELNFDEQFDALTLIHSFEHMDDPQATLRKCHTLLNRDGRLLIVVPNFGGWWSRAMRQDWQWLNINDHRYHYTRRALAALLGQAGFRVQSSRTYSAFAPSLPEMFLSAKRVFEWPGIRWRPVRSALYRLSSLAGVIGNPVADFAGRGAELQVLARPT